ncbi:CLN3 protein-domain-containing protein [Russula compacta]|nr:CLN3 protein-domain-containing protein [Russula compacta]
MPIESQQFELPAFSTRSDMNHESHHDPSIRDLTEEEEGVFSEGENKDDAEITQIDTSPFHDTPTERRCPHPFPRRHRGAYVLGLGTPQLRAWPMCFLLSLGPVCEAYSSCIFSGERRNLFRLNLSFFLFGLINNVLYVIILSAALDLVPPSTPKGIILFWNIAPSLIAKFSWPYILRGRIRYVRRLIGCCFLSVTGMIVVAASEGLSSRLFGISCASLASGLGELTFLQLSTTYHPPSVAGRGVGYFASGTGAAGLAGAFLWWEIRSLGVRIGVGLSSVLPFVIPLTYFLLLPRPHAFSTLVLPSVEDSVPPTSEYTPLPVSEEDAVMGPAPSKTKALSIADKWQLLKPMISRYMVPLFSVYLFEYTINQGVAPTLVYPVPTLESSPIFGHIIHSIRDYYPLWQVRHLLPHYLPFSIHLD